MGGVGGQAHFADAMGLADDDAMDHSMLGGVGASDAALMAQNGAREQNVVSMALEQNIEAMENMAQFAAMAANGADDEDEFEYNYQNPLDASHFVPDLKGEGGALDIDGDDLIDDPNRKVDKIRVEYAVSAKKVNVRKLKLKLWDRIDGDLQLKKDSHNDEDDEDIDMAAKENANAAQNVTFQDSLDSLPANISSAISIHMCFICLLHLANEKELQFVPKRIKTDGDDGMMPVRGDFEIQYADAESAMEMDATKINPVMVLGMQ